MDATLRALAAAYGIQAAYTDALGRRRSARDEAVVAALRALGAPLAGAGGAAEALRARAREIWCRTLEPVQVVWQGRRAALSVRQEAGRPSQLPAQLTLETGETRALGLALAPKPIETADVDGKLYAKFLAPLPKLPLGYHTLATGRPDHSACLVIVAPYRCYAASDARSWSVFLPLYAAHSDRSLATGDFTDLARLIDWVGSLGGAGVATLPLLAAFLKAPFDPSPYAPVSRLFWNEFYLDLGAPPEAAAPRVRAFLTAPATVAEFARLGAERHVDYRSEMELKRRILDLLAAQFFADSGNTERRKAFDAFMADAPLAEDYARFQAAVELRGDTWPRWPAAMQAGGLEPPDYDAAAYRRHLYAQWLAEDQLGDAARRARSFGRGLYLDLPLGVHYDGFDVWRHRALFALGAAAGAPPDPFFTKGQNWGFPPLHPEANRADGYRYVRSFLHRHLRHAGVLRIDHVMALHRLFWIPHGFEATDGLYVHSPADEWYAVLALESHRHESLIIGENLGTVPRQVNQALAAHGVQRMYVVQYEVQPPPSAPLNPVPADTAASLNTHDMPPFAAFYHAADVDDRIALGLLDEAGAQAERSRRAAIRASLAAALTPGRDDLPSLLPALLYRLAASPSRLLIVNLEDLWYETAPQNTPGTVAERPNWRRRSALSLEALRELPAVTEVLTQINRIRKEDPHG